MPVSCARVRRLWPLPCALLLLAVAGCGARQYPVRGQVTFDDGKPVDGGLVVFEKEEGDHRVMARGPIEADGTYQLGTKRPGDGAPAGKYRVLVSPKFDPEAIDHPERKPPFDPRFSEYKTSGLEYEVKPGANDFPIRVTRTKGTR